MKRTRILVSSAAALLVAAAVILSLSASGGPASAGRAPAFDLVLAQQQGSSSSAPWYAAKLKALGFKVPSKPKAAKDIQAVSLSGERIALSDLKGSVVILNFWATWCPPCREEMPSIQRMYDSLKAKGLKVVAISSGEDKATVSTFVKKNKYTFPIYLDESGAASETYGIRAIPSTFIIDKQGKMIGSVEGGMAYDSADMLAFLTELASK